MSMSDCQWSPHAARRMADCIHTEVKGMVAHSRLSRKSEGVALVHRHELQVGELLGRGAFSEVHEVRIVRNENDAGGNNNDSYNHHQQQPRFAMKHLKQKLMSQPDNFRLAAAELAVEAHMLASFDHPNILKIRGWAANGVASFTTGRHDSFFLLLDRLDETLDQRIVQWQRMQAIHEAQAAQNSTNVVTDLWRRVAAQQQQQEQRQQELALSQQRQHLYLEKMGVCSDLASALSYLHERGVIFRDLKPNNIGFLNGRVQLFDFGLSRELPGQNLHEPFEMSGKVGTLRYMAVEVACHRNYNVSADVYSWAMVSYETLTLQKPFGGWTRDMHSNLVCGRGVRPETNTAAVMACLQGAAGGNNNNNMGMRGLLEAAWNQSPDNRPNMMQVCQKMQMIEEEQLQVASVLLEQYQEYHHGHPNAGEMVVELPRDFSIVRKVPDRSHSALSEAFTRSTVSTSNESFNECL
jgi:serine/threonine protein kinase